ncbi:MAG: radical SAM/SPASM domain-containing protein [Bacteroidota bacterium]
MNNKNIAKLVAKMADNKMTRKLLLPQIEKELYNNLVSNRENELDSVRQKKFEWGKALLAGADRNISKGYIHGDVLQRLSKVLITNAFHEDRDKFRSNLNLFREKYGVDAPTFFVISPTKRCNLKCKGCYAGSTAKTAATLPYSNLKKFLQEFHNEAHGRFIVISGGEPLMYRSEGKTLTDLGREFPEIFFMFYTNGTLIDKARAEELAELSNMIPCISVEGFEKETDERRGKGNFKKILQSMENLRNVGLPFIISVTATSENTDLLLTDKFYDFYFDEQGASYMWQFQFMPIGRGKQVFDLMPAPEQRVKLYRKWEYLLKNKQYCVADFWNSGVLTDGCIAYGRRRGYLYIDWHGNVMPCVFVPYKADNIIEAQNEGRNLASILKSPMFVRGREWQHEYTLDHLENPNNMLMPCSIRDHYSNFRKNILGKENTGEDPVANEILNDAKYFERMEEYDRQLHKLTDPIWNREYLKNKIIMQPVHEKQTRKHKSYSGE